MAQPKYTIYKYVRLKDGSWRYCRAALYANHTIKADVVIVGSREEKHPEGNYYLACGGKWIPAGADALAAQRQRHALLSGNGLAYELYSGRSVPKAAAIQYQDNAANERKKVKDEISKYLDGMVASKRPGKSVRMNRNFLNAFATLVGKEYAGKPAADFSRERGEGVMGLTLSVADLRKAQSLLEEGTHRKLPVYDGIYGKSFLVPAELANGVWIEMVQK